MAGSTPAGYTITHTYELRFLRTDFRLCCVKILANTTIGCVLCLTHAKIPSAETSSTYKVMQFCAVCGAAAAALLTQGKANKPQNAKRAHF